jgi:hypothetical protein
MNTQKGYTIATVLIMGALMLVPTAIAQSQALTVSIPFDFYVATKLLPAGQYIVSPGGQSEAIQFQGLNGASAFVLTKGLKDNPLPDQSRLAFRQYGDQSFLVGIYWAGYRHGREMVTSAMEQRLAKSTGPAANVAIAGK